MSLLYMEKFDEAFYVLARINLAMDEFELGSFQKLLWI